MNPDDLPRPRDRRGPRGEKQSEPNPGANGRRTNVQVKITQTGRLRPLAPVYPEARGRGHLRRPLRSDPEPQLPRAAALPEDAPPTEEYKQTRVMFHRLGTAAENDQVIAAYGHSASLPILETDFPSVWLSPRSSHAVLKVKHGDNNEISLKNIFCVM